MIETKVTPSCETILYAVPRLEMYCTTAIVHISQSAFVDKGYTRRDRGVNVASQTHKTVHAPYWTEAVLKNELA
jgi:hypothetical protein